MRRNYFTAFAVAFSALFLLNVTSADAQRRGERDRKDKPGFAERLWYGGGFTLGFGANQFSSAFSFGISPMVGYKVLDFLSVGPRGSILYTSFKVEGFRAANLFDYSLGAFVRARVFQGIFIQGEVSQDWTTEIAAVSPPELNKMTFTRTNQLLGVGWNSSMGQGGLGTEIGLFYNFKVAADEQTSLNPLEYRFGITWRF